MGTKYSTQTFAGDKYLHFSYLQIRCFVVDGGTEGSVQVHSTNLLFPAEVSVKMKQYKDELLASCLTFVLSLPHDIIALDVRAYVPALQVGTSLVGVMVPRNVAVTAALTCQNPHPHPPPASCVVGPSWGGFSAPSLQPAWFWQRKGLSFKKPSLSTKFLVFIISFVLMYRWLLNWAWAMPHWQKPAWMPWKNGQFISANM